MRSHSKIAIAILGITSLILVGFLGLIVYMNWPSDRVIAKNLTVTPEWVELTVDPAIKPAYRSQYITLRIKDFSSNLNANSLKGSLELPGGVVVHPEIELYDKSGNRYEFRHSGSVRKDFDEPVFRVASFDLPQDREYTKLRIRSDKPFTCDRVAWIDYNPK